MAENHGTDVTSEEARPRRRVLRMVFPVVSMASFVGLVVMMATGLHKVHMGSNLDVYRTSWLIEFNWVWFLVLVVALLVGLVGFASLRYIEWRESRT